jgi:hypothetical protein
MTPDRRRRAVPLFSLAIVAALLVFHGVYTFRGVPPPRDAYRTAFADAGYVLRYVTGQTPESVIATRRNGKLHLFHSGEIALQANNSGTAVAQRLAAAARPALDRLKALGVIAIPVVVPTKLSLYREELPYSLGGRGRWSRPETNGGAEDPEAIHRVLAESLPEALDLYEPFRALRRREPDRLLYPPLDYHWTSFASAMAVDAIGRLLGERQLLSKPPEQISLGLRPFGASYLTDQYPLPHWFVARGHEFAGEAEAVRFLTTPESPGGGRLILLGTSFSGGAPEEFLGQLRSIGGREFFAFVRPDNGYAGGFRMMKEAGFTLQPGDLLIWELPLCCLNLDAPGIPGDF